MLFAEKHFVERLAERCRLMRALWFLYRLVKHEGVNSFYPHPHLWCSLRGQKSTSDEVFFGEEHTYLNECHKISSNMSKFHHNLSPYLKLWVIIKGWRSDTENQNARKIWSIIYDSNRRWPIIFFSHFGFRYHFSVILLLPSDYFKAFHWLALLIMHFTNTWIHNY
jgi:hypothetical protein